MTKRWQQIISAYVALCFALAGVIGLSPGWHVGVEHGGRGVPHTHTGGNGWEVMAGHAHPHPSAHKSAELFRVAAPEPLHTSPGSSLTIFGLEPQHIYRAVGRWLARMTESFPAAPEPDEPGHTHHSLAQLLLSGTVEGALEIAPLIFAPERCSLYSLVPESRAVVSELYSPTAGRGPPFFC